MISRNPHAPRFAALLAGAFSVLAAGATTASAQQQQQQQQGSAQIPQGWFKACTKQAEVDICNVQNIMAADTGQLLTGVSLIEIKGQVNNRVFQVTVPSGRLLPPGVNMQIDGGQTQKLDYMVCLPDRCVAEVPLNDDLVNRFKRGSRITLTSVNFQNQPNPIQVTLEGFTAAFDGEPIRQTELEEMQRRMSEHAEQNRADYERRLREAQEQAKQAN